MADRRQATVLFPVFLLAVPAVAHRRAWTVFRAPRGDARDAGRLVLVANLVIAGCVTALRGGRIDAADVGERAAR
jgi:hypothetical protein